MKKADLVRIYNEKFGNEDIDGGISQKVFTDRLNKIRTILKEVFADKSFKGSRTRLEKDFYIKIIAPVLKSTKEISKEGMNFFLPLVRYHNNKVFDLLKKEYCSTGYLNDLTNIEEIRMEELLCDLNESYLKLSCYEGQDIDSKELYMNSHDIINNIEEELNNIYLAQNGFSISVNEEEKIENRAKDNQSYEHKMILITYYRLCNCIEDKRDKLIDTFLSLMQSHKRLQTKNKIFKIIIKEIQEEINNQESDLYRSEADRELVDLIKRNKNLFGKYLKY
ncbi:MAG: hypothetical protein E6712_09655 [Clostridium sp.]|uniref:hypothetical protein n=1 Tax=Clostridium sp. TaxID=1506 RepID=UPI00290556EF|nr:hypothetical protein [Clostridium sp.]MDU1936420.1 hypothetical protein [Clostridium sp.]MDU2045053.1 hypothetical protein [Clostridium sp.]